MEKFTFTSSEIRYLWRHRGNKNYELKRVKVDGLFIKNLEFEDVRSGCELSGKIIVSPKEGEAYHWPRLQHENLAPLLEIVSINEKVSVYLSNAFDKSLRAIVNEHEFLSAPNCFERKKSYAEDILWGLDYLHEKRLCLMNLNLSNIYIDSASDKAVIMNFNCLTLAERAMKCSVDVPCLYRAPELKNNSFEFDARAAEMWACGTMMLEIIMGHILPTSFRGDGAKIVLDMVENISQRTLEEANPRSYISSTDFTSFRSFLNLFLTRDPILRTTAKNAAISSFLHKVRGGFDPKFGRVWELRSTQQPGASSGFANTSEQSRQKGEKIARIAPNCSSGDFANEVERCKKNLQICSPYNQFVNLEYVSDDRGFKKDKLHRSLDNDKYNDREDSNKSEDDIMIGEEKNGLSCIATTDMMIKSLENGSSSGVQTFEDCHTTSEAVKRISHLETISEKMSRIESAEVGEGTANNVNEFSGICLCDDIIMPHFQNRHEKFCTTKIPIIAEHSMINIGKKIEELDISSDIFAAGGDETNDITENDCCSHFTSMVNSISSLHDLFVSNDGDSMEDIFTGTKNTNTEKSTHENSPFQLTEILEDDCDTIKKNKDILNLKGKHAIINSSEYSLHNSIPGHRTENYPVQTCDLEQDVLIDRGISRSEIDDNRHTDIFPDGTNVKEAESKDVNHSFNFVTQRSPSDIKISTKVPFSRKSEPDLYRSRSSFSEDWNTNISTSPIQNSDESTVCEDSKKIMSILDTDCSNKWTNSKNGETYKSGYPLISENNGSSEISSRNNSPQIKESHFSTDGFKNYGQIQDVSISTEVAALEEVLDPFCEEGYFEKDISLNDENIKEDHILGNDTVDDSVLNSEDILSSSTTSERNCHSIVETENVHMALDTIRTVISRRLRNQRNIAETPIITGIILEDNTEENVLVCPEDDTLSNDTLDHDTEHNPSFVSENTFRPVDVDTPDDAPLQKKEDASAKGDASSINSEIPLNSVISFKPIKKKKKKPVKKFFMRLLCPGCKATREDREEFFAGIKEQ